MEATEKKKSKWGIGVVGCCGIGLLIIGGLNQYKEYKEAPLRQAIAESQAEKEAAYQENLTKQRNAGFVRVKQYVNAFGETTGASYDVMGVTPDSFFRVATEGKDIRAVCFSAFTDNENKKLFSPLVTTVVDVKFDNGETKSFSASRGSGGTDLCIESTKRFMYNVKYASSMQVALPFLDGSTRVYDVYTFNLKQLNGITL